MLLLAAAVALGVAAGLVLQSRNDSGAAPARGRTMSISTSVEPRVQLFGDPVTARVDLLFDRRRVLPAADKIRIEAPFRPFEVVDPPTVERAESGDLVHLSYTYRLICLDRRCASHIGSQRVCRTAGSRDQTDSLFRATFVDIGDDHGRSFPGKGQGGNAADACCAAGDQRNLSRQTFPHWLLPDHRVSDFGT